jgi:hypothetical protein
MGDAAQEQAPHCDADHGSRHIEAGFVVAHEPAPACHQAESAFYDPTSRQHFACHSIRGRRPGLIRPSRVGFKVALQDVPRIVEETIRAQYASAWEVYKKAGMDHILSGITKQEIAAFIDPLPDQIRAIQKTPVR